MNKRVMLTAIAGLLAVAMMASPAYAQRGGRGGGWGGGGGRGWNGGGWGGRGWDGGGYYGGYGRGFGYGGYGVGFGLGGYGWDGYGQGYYGTPDNYAYGTYADYQPYYYSQPMNSTNMGLSNYQLQTNPTGNTYASQSFYSGPSNAGSAGSAQLTVKVPADAQLWLGTMQSGQTGAERHFTFPALAAGDNYFTLRSTWNDNGRMVTRDRQVNMKAGANTTVDLTQATDTNAAPSKPLPDDSHPTPLNTDDGKTKTPPIRPIPNPGLPK